MTVAESIQKAVSQGDIKGLRIMMKNSLLVDPTFNEFKEMNRLTRDVDGLYEEHDGRELIEDKSTWDDNYMNKLMVQVVGNFSHERVDHLKEVVRYLRPVGDTPKPPPIPPPGSNRGLKIAGGAVAGGMVGGTIAGIAGGSVLVGTLLGAGILGAVVAIATKEG